MKKKLLLALHLLVGLITVQAQVTQINSNKSLVFTFPLNNVTSILVSGIDSSIWTTGGTLATTVQLATNIKFEDAISLQSGKLLFRGTTPATGSEVFITDGTGAGTTLLKDINTGAASSDPADFTQLNGIVYFSAVSAAEGRELWKSNGTAAGTTLVKDIVAGSGSSNIEDGYNLFSTGTYLLFAANTVAEGLELWKSDGTTAGTVLLKNINTGADSSKPNNFYQLNNIVLFTAKDATHGSEIWKTDGTANGTVLVKDINPGPASSTEVEFFPGFSFPVFSGFHTFNNRAYCTLTSGTGSSAQVWGTDGTAANTLLLKDIFPSATFPQILLTNAVNLPAKFIFGVSDGASAAELWQSDGTPAGTSLFKAFSAANNSLPFILTDYLYDINTGAVTNPLFQGNKFFFTATTDAEGNELWISDGTLANTKLVKDINPGTASAFQFPSYSYTSDTLYFAADDGVKGNELWKSDGTTAGTLLVADINAGAGNSDPFLSFYNSSTSKLIFSANNGDATTNDLYVLGGGVVSNTGPCPGGTVSITSSITGAAYQWQVNTGTGFVNVVNNTNYAGATMATLQINNAPSGFYGYQYRCNVNGSFSTVTILKFVNYWNGSVNNLWSNPANWSCGVLPDSNTDVVISTGTPVLNVNGSCRSITINAAASFTVNTGFTLQVMH